MQNINLIIGGYSYNLQRNVWSHFTTMTDCFEDTGSNILDLQQLNIDIFNDDTFNNGKLDPLFYTVKVFFGCKFTSSFVSKNKTFHLIIDKMFNDLLIDTDNPLISPSNLLYIINYLGMDNENILLWYITKRLISPLSIKGGDDVIEILVNKKYNNILLGENELLLVARSEVLSDEQRKYILDNTEDDSTSGLITSNNYPRFLVHILNRDDIYTLNKKSELFKKVRDLHSPVMVSFVVGIQPFILQSDNSFLRLYLMKHHEKIELEFHLNQYNDLGLSIDIGAKKYIRDKFLIEALIHHITTILNSPNPRDNYNSYLDYPNLGFELLLTAPQSNLVYECVMHTIMVSCVYARSSSQGLSSLLTFISSRPDCITTSFLLYYYYNYVYDEDKYNYAPSRSRIQAIEAIRKYVIVPELESRNVDFSSNQDYHPKYPQISHEDLCHEYPSIYLVRYDLSSEVLSHKNLNLFTNEMIISIMDEYIDKYGYTNLITNIMVKREISSTYYKGKKPRPIANNNHFKSTLTKPVIYDAKINVIKIVLNFPPIYGCDTYIIPDVDIDDVTLDMFEEIEGVPGYPTIDNESTLPMIYRGFTDLTTDDYIAMYNNSWINSLERLSVSPSQTKLSFLRYIISINHDVDIHAFFVLNNITRDIIDASDKQFRDDVIILTKNIGKPYMSQLTLNSKYLDRSPFSDNKTYHLN